MNIRASFENWLQAPLRVLAWCMALAFVSLIFDGSLLRWWRLHHDQERLHQSLAGIQARTRRFEYQIQEAAQPEFIEKQARDQLDLVKEGDLVFVFSDGETDVKSAQMADKTMIDANSDKAE